MSDRAGGSKGIIRGIGRLEHLRREDVLTDAEFEVTRDALLGATQGVGEGRSIRIEACHALAPSAGSPCIVMDVLAKARICKYDWTRLALRLDEDSLRIHLLGLRYESAPERWDDLLAKLERLPQARQEEHLSRAQFEGVKYSILGRVGWLELVGELIWLQRESAGLGFWQREDGWIVSNEDVYETVEWVIERTPHEDSPVSGERVHHYFDWVWDQCWRYYNGLIAEGDMQYLRYKGVQRLEKGLWSFGE